MSEVLGNLITNDFLKLLDGRNRQIVVLLNSGVTSKTEIADVLGYANHSAVSKRLVQICRAAEASVLVRHLPPAALKVRDQGHDVLLSVEVLVCHHVRGQHGCVCDRLPVEADTKVRRRLVGIFVAVQVLVENKHHPCQRLRSGQRFVGGDVAVAQRVLDQFQHVVLGDDVAALVDLSQHLPEHRWCEGLFREVAIDDLTLSTA
ncbi:hypothetical protein [Lentzea alba]|uniref:hypothetical protein n=1 Tax=Lentzea alba TaxID=2714351 RepID=UPI001A9459A4|nr:hypothetical protein [Lentzea alba]